MSTTNQQNATNADGHTAGHEKLVEHMSHDERQTAQAAARFGYGPLAHVSTGEDRLPAFGGEFQPGLYKPIVDRKIANPAPLGLCAFALTTFVLSAINMGARDIMVPNMVVAIAYGYGGLVQLLAGMWYVASVMAPAVAFLDAANVAWIPGKWPSETLLVPLLCRHTAVSGFRSVLFSLQVALVSRMPMSRSKMPLPSPMLLVST